MNYVQLLIILILLQKNADIDWCKYFKYGMVNLVAM